MRRRKALGRQIVMALMMALVGMVIKKQGNEYADLVIILGFILVIVLYAARFWQKKQKVITDYTRVGIVTLASLSGLTLSFRLIRKASWDHPAIIIALIITAIWLISEMLPSSKSKQKQVV